MSEHEVPSGEGEAQTGESGDNDLGFDVQDLINDDVDEDESPQPEDAGGGEESQPETAEPEGDDEADAGEAEKPSQPAEPEPTPEPEWVDRLNKAIGNLDQASKRLQNTPNDQNAKAAEKARSKIEELLDQSDEDIDPYKGVRTVAEETRKLGERLSDERVEQLVDQRAEQKAQAAVRDFEQRQQHIREFERKQGVSYEDYSKAVQDHLKGQKFEDDREWNAAVRGVAPFVLEKLKAKSESTSEEPAKEAPAKPKATNTVKPRATPAKNNSDAKTKMREMMMNLVKEED